MFKTDHKYTERNSEKLGKNLRNSHLILHSVHCNHSKLVSIVITFEEYFVKFSPKDIVKQMKMFNPYY